MAEAATPPGGDGERHNIDWLAAERSPEFRELLKKKRAFVVPATAFFFIWYFGFIILASVAPDFMGESIYQGFTVGYLLALSQFIMVWVLGAMYLRRADRDFDPLAKRAAERAIEVGHGPQGEPGAEGAQRAATTPREEVPPR